MVKGDAEVGFLSRLFNAVPSEERDGIHLDINTPQWKLSPAKDLPSFLRALAELAPEGAILYLEGGTPGGDLLPFLTERSVPEQAHVAMGTIWPRPKKFHVPATRDNLLALAELMEHAASPKPQSTCIYT